MVELQEVPGSVVGLPQCDHPRTADGCDQSLDGKPLLVKVKNPDYSQAEGGGVLQPATVT